MKKFLFICSFCLSLILVFNTHQTCYGAEKNKPAETGKKWSTWISLDSYKIGSGDVLEIVTWKEPDFSREAVLVRIDGKITFPLLGDVQASNRTPLLVKKEIEKGLKDFVDNPIVTVTVRDPGSQKFYILGEVVNTGEYNLIKDLTVLQAFALAGGFTEWASKKEIILLRNENGKEKIIRVNYKNIIQGKDFSQNIHIKANDTIIVP
ncbi:MAG: polysaccharide biosynthesis/export family protein [Deltaproteobacteria bacterium]|nr:polysaccharide biosynthesis/export family protein [Deltaproteobacteria bacterium]